MTISQRIFMLLKQKGKKQKELAEYTGISTSAISAWNKNNTNPTAESLSTIADFLEVSLDYLLTGKEKTVEHTKDVERLLNNYNIVDDISKQLIQERAETLAELAAERAAEQSQKTKRIAAPAADEQLEPEDNDPEQPFIKIIHSFYKVSAGQGFDLSGDDEWEEIEIPDTHEARKADYALTIQGDSMEPIYYNGDIVLVKKQDSVEIGQVGIFVLDGSGFIKKYSGDRLISLNEKYDDILLEDYSDCHCNGRVIGRV
ncbi:MAG: helix-turn-helix domain-containing protein [Ruminococcaceae bacterium]|nr:helix-turn-helix domain-containing protein [Oscillospiraceae bacterium]